MGAFDYLTTTALSMTVSGNTGIAPFSTLFIVGFIERLDPDLLAMEGWTEKVLSSWWSLLIFGVLALLELIGKCIPIIDEIIDSVEIFVVPVFSILGSLATFGLFTLASELDDPDPGDDGTTRSRELATGENFLWLVKVTLCIFGICLALLVHLFKMLIRIFGQGCMTCCITTMEYTWITISLFLAIFIKPIAIVIAVVLIGSATFGFMKRHKLWRRNENYPGGAAPASIQQQHQQAPTQPAQPTTYNSEAPAPVAPAAQVVQPPEGEGDVEVQIPVAQVELISDHDAEGDFPEYNPDDFERPPATAPEEDTIPTVSVEVPTSPIEPED